LPFHQTTLLAIKAKRKNKKKKMTAPDFSQWKKNHTMIRVKDPIKRIAFYNQLGFEHLGISVGNLRTAV
jgi:hypothetical protein